MAQQPFDSSTTCRTCQKVANRHSGLMPGNSPKGGDVALCDNCGTISMFVQTPLGYLMREPTPAEQAEIDADPVITRMRNLRREGARTTSLVREWRRTTPLSELD